MLPPCTNVPAGNGNRTRTAVTGLGILSPLCLPIPPSRRKLTNYTHFSKFLQARFYATTSLAGRQRVSALQKLAGKATAAPAGRQRVSALHRNSRVRRLLPAMHFRQQSGGTPHACGGTPLHGARYDKMRSRQLTAAWARRNCAAILPGQEYVDLLDEIYQNVAGIAQQFRLGKGLATPAPCPLHMHPVLVLYWMHLYVPELQ